MSTCGHILESRVIMRFNRRQLLKSAVMALAFPAVAAIGPTATVTATPVTPVRTTIWLRYMSVMVADKVWFLARSIKGLRSLNQRRQPDFDVCDTKIEFDGVFADDAQEFVDAAYSVGATWIECDRPNWKCA